MRVADPLANPVEACAAIAEAARAAGEVALRHFGSNVRSWTKGPSASPVTEADIAVDAFLRDRLTELAPYYGWLSEETADSTARLDCRRIWIVDPIDGTRAFMADGADWCVAIGLVEDGRPIAAVVYAPVSDELFAAAHGAGASRNGRPIAASERSDPLGARLAGPKHGHPLVSHLVAQAASHQRIRSLALRLARVAEGSVDLAFGSAGAQDWDLAAADLLVHEAGGRLTTLDGRPLAYNRPTPVHGPLVASGARLYGSVLAAFGASQRSSQDRSR